MKYTLILLVLLTVACSTREKGAVLEKGTPDYEMAAKFTDKVPEFNPDDNLVILTTRDYEITIGDVVDRMRSRFGSRVDRIAQSPRSSILRLYKELAQSVAYSKIINEAAASEGIEVSEAEIDSILQLQYTRAGGEEKFMNFVIQNGATLETLRRDIKTSEIQRLYFEQKFEQNTLTESEIEAAMNDDRFASVRHILLMFKTNTDSAKKVVYSKMEGILERAKAGEDFAKLATEFTEDPGSKNNGGLYADFEKGKMVPPFEEAAFNVPIGEISDIVETQYGYHILKVVDRKKEDRPKEVVVNNLEQLKRQQSMQNFYTGLSEENNFEFAQVVSD